MQLVVCDTEKRAEALLQQKHATPSLTTIVVVQPISDQLKANAEDSGVALVSFDDVIVSCKAIIIITFPDVI